MQRHSVTSLETARSFANDPSGGGLRGNSPGNYSVSYRSFVYGSTGGVCGWSLTAGKILFTGRQTCSLYLVLWLYHRTWWNKGKFLIQYQYHGYSTPSKIPFILDRNLAKANCKGNRVSTSCDIVVLDIWFKFMLITTWNEWCFNPLGTKLIFPSIFEI